MTEEEGRQMAGEFGTGYCDVSAKANQNVVEVFNDLAERIVTRLAATPPPGAAETESAMRPYGAADSAPVPTPKASKPRGFLCCSRPQT